MIQRNGNFVENEYGATFTDDATGEDLEAKLFISSASTNRVRGRLETYDGNGNRNSTINFDAGN